MNCAFFQRRALYIAICLVGLFLYMTNSQNSMAKANEEMKVMDVAPDFTLTSSTGEKVSLSDFKGRKNVVLYFYPKDFTPICTAEACGFQDNYDAFKDVDAEVIGISSDSESSHKDFADKHKLSFILLSDPDGKVRKLFKVPNTLGVLPGRVTYVIDKEGKIRNIFVSQMDAAKHVSEALHVLATIEGNKGSSKTSDKQ